MWCWGYLCVCVLVVFGVYNVTRGIPVCLCECCLLSIQCGTYCLGGYLCVCALVVFGVYCSVALIALATYYSFVSNVCLPHAEEMGVGW